MRSLPLELAARRFDPAEAPLVASWVADEAEAVRWGGPGMRWPVDDAQFAAMLAEPDRSVWTATLGAEIAGHFQLFHDRRRRTMRLGRFTIAPQFRGRRLATPLVELAAGLAFGNPDVHRMELQVYKGNMPAQAAYTRAGFTLEGTLREDVPVLAGGQTVFWSTGIMSLLRSEWMARVGAVGGAPAAAG